MHKIFTVWLVLFFSLLLTGCSTVAGVGKDIQQVGSALEKEAEEEKTRMK